MAQNNSKPNSKAASKQPETTQKSPNMILNGLKKPRTTLKLSKTAPKQLIKAENGPKNVQNSPKSCQLKMVQNSCKQPETPRDSLKQPLKGPKQTQKAQNGALMVQKLRNSPNTASHIVWVNLIGYGRPPDRIGLTPMG
jgi:hypothetical protein